MFPLLTSPVYALIKIPVLEPLPWEDKHEQAFTRLEQAPQEPSALGLPNYSKPFTRTDVEADTPILGPPDAQS